MRGDWARLIFCEGSVFKEPERKRTSVRNPPSNNFVFRKKIDDLEEELTQGQETEKNLQTNLNHIQDNQLLLRNQHKARLDKRLGLFRDLKVGCLI